jgi:hypothetical protein
MAIPSPETIAVLGALYYGFPIVVALGAVWIGIEIVRGFRAMDKAAPQVDAVYLDDGE